MAPFSGVPGAGRPASLPHCGAQMSTVRDCLVMAYDKIGVQNPTGDEIATAVAAFGAMISGWKLDGIDVWGADQAINGGFPIPEINYSDFTAAAPFPMPDAFREAVAFCLAEKLAPGFGKAFDATLYMRKIQANYMVIPTARTDPLMFRLNPNRRVVL